MYACSVRKPVPVCEGVSACVYACQSVCTSACVYLCEAIHHAAPHLHRELTHHVLMVTVCSVMRGMAPSISEANLLGFPFPVSSPEWLASRPSILRPAPVKFRLMTATTLLSCSQPERIVDFSVCDMVGPRGEIQGEMFTLRYDRCNSIQTNRMSLFAVTCVFVCLSVCLSFSL